MRGSGAHVRPSLRRTRLSRPAGEQAGSGEVPPRAASNNRAVVVMAGRSDHGAPAVDGERATLRIV